jgi:phage N-6-adenine-methyltransferase
VLGTGENEWFTPREWIDLARHVLDAIDVDPASNPLAQQTVKAATFYSKDDDGLSKDWHGRVWLNPPYAQPYIAQFADKMLAELAAGHVTQSIMLTHNYTDTSWFQKLAERADAICFTRGRIRFESPAGEIAAPTQGQAFFYFGDDPERFSKVFAEAGFIR